KNLGGFGEGGLVTTGDADFAQRCRQLRNHGQTETYLHAYIGGNFRLDTLKAGILGVKLARLGEFNAARRAHAARYDEMLGDLDGVRTPVVRPHNEMIYHQYSILCARRDALKAALAEAGIGSGIYYPVPLHRQPCFADLGYREGQLPVSEESARRILALPIHPMLTDADITRVGECIQKFYNAAPRSAAPAGAK
ncbi:MAG TPA: DegT/DnrJ/EryC1/StrS family aminotransferase, partial [Phycisphaerae bacterium]|nr:DegT/DnrJ/EryC1/StrS family aminotransferase [Phycisphaerae bacterium]